MVAPSFGAAGTYLTGATSTDWAIAVPSGTAADEIVLVFLYYDGDDTIDTVESGFTLKVNEGTASNGLAIYWKRCTGADSGTYDFAQTASTWREGIAIRYTDCLASGDPFDVFDSANQATGSTTPAVSNTTTVADTLQVWAGSNYNGGAWTPPTSYTERADASSDFSVADLAQASIGGSGSITGTCAGGSTFSSAFLGALAPTAVTTLVQEGYAFGEDDGTESAHTLETQDTTITEATETPRTLRMLVEETGGVAFTGAVTLQYRRDDEATGEWRDVPGTGVSSGFDEGIF